MDPLKLKSRTINGRREGPHLLVIGGVHGDEFEPMLACRQLLREVYADALRGKLTIVPIVNEPAFARCSRTGDDGLDLARVCPGDVNGSTTMQIAAELAKLIRNADYLVDLHTAGSRYELLPLAGYTLHSEKGVVERQRAMARAFGLPLVWGTNPRFNGTSLAVARDEGVPAIYVENGGGATYDRSRVNQVVYGCRQVMRLLGMLDETLGQHKPRYFVEDDRDNSGHLQRQHPSPVAGFFEPDVDLGEVVTPEQIVGHVSDPLGDHRTPIVAGEAGTVLFLRRFPSVQVGDSLLAILPITSPGEVRYPRELS